tara:strand:+ start:10552 stop:11139 length:588 start_codon:yes stop_codon:yes gene_type:complete
MSKKKCQKLSDKILNGRMLAIDPSSGATDRATGSPSIAGFAYFDKGILVESGLILIPESQNKETRFRYILDLLQSQFNEDYDILALEDIPLARRRGNFNTSQTLIQACGVFIAGVSGQLIELNSHTWQAVARRIGGWKKGDEADAQYIGLAAIAFASGYDQKITEKNKLKIIKELVTSYNFWELQEILNHWKEEV